MAAHPKLGGHQRHQRVQAPVRQDVQEPGAGEVREQEDCRADRNHGAEGQHEHPHGRGSRRRNAMEGHYVRGEYERRQRENDREL
jgi:hypothetical protein